MSTGLPVSSTRLILQTKRIVLFSLGAHWFGVNPGPSLPLLRLWLWLYQYQHFLCSVVKEQHYFSTKIKFSLCIKGKYSLLSLELPKDWTWRWTWSVSSRDLRQLCKCPVHWLQCLNCSRDAGAFLWIHLCREEWLRRAVVLKWESCFLWTALQIFVVMFLLST